MGQHQPDECMLRCVHAAASNLKLTMLALWDDTYVCSGRALAKSGRGAANRQLLSMDGMQASSGDALERMLAQ